MNADRWTAKPQNIIANALKLVASVAISLLLIVGNSGCSYSSAESPNTSVQSYGALPGLQKSHHVGLRDELARLAEQHATPRELQMRTVDSRGNVFAKARIHDKDNAAIALRNVFPENMRAGIAARIDRTYPTDGLALTPIDLRVLRDVTKSYEKYRHQFREAVAKPICELHWDHMSGVMADSSLVDIIRMGVRLEVMAVAVAWADNRDWDARGSFDLIFRAISFLAAERHLEPRLEACRLRREGLKLVEIASSREPLNVALAEHLYDLLTRQLAAWPADDLAWIGERADGLHFYEMIRDGKLLSLLNSEELQGLRDSGKLATLAEHIEKNIDEDQMFYLDVMREVISLSQRPYAERQGSLDQLRQRMEDARHSATYPYVAVELLLTNIADGQRLQAQDREACEQALQQIARRLNRDQAAVAR